MAGVLVGVRCIRGPDWQWGDQDGGVGHVGTIVEPAGPCAQGTVVVVWDYGFQQNYRAGQAGAYDLRLLDNASAGVHHPNSKCDACSVEPIYGIKWTCSTCQDFDLCSPCYMKRCHELSHKFVRWDRDYEIKMKKLSESSLCPVKAPTTGTKWHNTPAPKMWYEAKTEDGNSYFWHVENHESRWDPPPGGFVSIEEQAKIQAAEDAKEHKKKKVISEQKQFHRQHEDNPLPGLSGGPGLSPRRDPYGGWSKVEQEPEESVDLGLPCVPQVKVKAPAIQHEPRHEWKEKTVDSLGPVKSVTAPAINFRKRKAASLRSREEDD